MNKIVVKHKIRFLLIAVLGLVLLYILIQSLRCTLALKKAAQRLESYHAQTAKLSYGNMTYVDQGKGDVILSVHGIFGGYDQAFDTCKNQTDTYRVIAPSRFGYLGSDVLGEGTPGEQAAAYVELLDQLGIDKVYLLATSAGGTVAMRFALDYPERTRGLILYCSAPPLTVKPDTYIAYQGPPKALCNDWGMFLISPLFEPIMGMAPSTINGMLPVSERKTGVILDASITNPDMARHFDAYPIETIEVPVLILHAKDDKLASYKEMEQGVTRFQDATFISFETGGHLMAGHAKEINQALANFTKKCQEKQPIV